MNHFILSFGLIWEILGGITIIIGLIASIITILVFITGKYTISEFFKTKINLKRIIVYPISPISFIWKKIVFYVSNTKSKLKRILVHVTLLASILITCFLLFKAVYPFLSKTKTKVVNNASKVDTLKKTNITNTEINPNKESIIPKKKNDSIKKNNRNLKNENIQEKKLNWPTYKHNSTGDHPLIFYVKRENDLYLWKILDTETLKERTIHKTNSEPTNFLFDEFDDRFYFVINGTLFYSEWPNLEPTTRALELPHRRSDGTSKYVETDIWQDKQTGLFRIAIMGEAKKISDYLMIFNDNEYRTYNDPERGKYCYVRNNRSDTAKFKKVYFRDTNHPEMIEIYESNWKKWHLVTGAPTTSEAHDTPGFKQLDDLINNHSDSAYAFSMLRNDIQCLKPNECFDHTETNTLTEIFSDELKQNKILDYYQYGHAVGNIKINTIHELYFPIIRSDMYHTHQSNPVILSDNDLKQKIPLSLFWDAKSKLKDYVVISTDDNFILIQDEFNHSDQCLGLLYNSNNSDGKPIFPIKGSYITFLPEYMVSLMTEDL